MRVSYDGVWEVPEGDRIAETMSGHAHIGSLRRKGARGGLPADVFLALQQDRVTMLSIACSLRESHIPDTVHDDILCEVGINTGHAEPAARGFGDREMQGTGQDFEQVRRRSRDPAFSKAVLDAYVER